MQTRTICIAALATILIGATASTALAELCAGIAGNVYVRESCTAREDAVRETTLCTSPKGHVRVRSTCRKEESEATKLAGSLCSAKQGAQLRQRTTCKNGEQEISRAKLCLRAGGKLVARGECRASELPVADMQLPSGLVVQPTVGTFGQPPPNARVVIDDPVCCRSSRGTSAAASVAGDASATSWAFSIPSACP